MRTTDNPLRKEIRTDMWTDGGIAGFRAKPKHTVERGSRGMACQKRPVDELHALAHMASTAWPLSQIAGTNSLSPRDRV